MTKADVLSEVKTQILNKGILEKFEDLKTEIENAFDKLGVDSHWIIYNQNEVLLGKGKKISDESIDFGVLKEIRLFSKKGEIHVWKYDGAFRFRLRIDDSGNHDEKSEKIYIEEQFRLNTEEEVKKIKSSSQSALIRTSGIKLAGDLKGKEIPNKYRIYNYYDFDEIGIVKFNDARLVEFISEGGVN